MEQWKSVPGMPRIEASDFGRIRRDGKLTAAKQVLRQYRQRIIALAWIGPARGRWVRRRRGGSDRPDNLYYATVGATAAATANPRRITS
jgi:hypothetical protein